MIKALYNEIRQLLTLKSFRFLVGKIRFFYFFKLKANFKTIESEFAIPNTISHNLKNLSTFGFTRMDKIIKPLSVIEKLNENSSFLVIGPRNEEDLLNLSGNGFKLKNITGLDLISYSPLIDTGDMHAMKYADNSFDCVISGWTIAYSNDFKKATSEMIRVCKPNGIIAISMEYSELTKSEQIEKLGYDLSTNIKRITDTKELMALFEPNISHIYFNHNAPNKISHSVHSIMKNVSSLVCIFDINK